MISQPKRVINRRKSGTQQRRSQNLLEVTVRNNVAIEIRNRFILVWTCRLLLFAAIVGGGIYGVRMGLRRLLWENPEYNLAAVEINDDGHALTREIVLNTAGLRLGQNVFSFSLAKAREAVAALPQVDHVEMQRMLPNKVVVDLSERRPVAWVADNQTEDATASDKAFLIDAKRVLFKPKQRLDEYLRLPSICGVPTENFLSGETIDKPEVTAALDLVLHNNDSGRFRIQSVDISKGYCMIATDAKRVRVTFALEKVDRQLERLGAVLDRFASAHQEIQTVNLLVEKNIPVTFAPAPDREPDLESSTAPAVAENSPIAAEAEPVRHAEKAVAPLKKKTAGLAEFRERKKKGKQTDAFAEKKEPKPVRRAEPVIRRALPATIAAAPPTPPINNHSIFSFLHGQR